MDIYSIDIDNSTINVHILKKDIKNIHLKVTRDLQVKISVPLNTPFEWIEEFVGSKKEWIKEQLYQYRKTIGYNSLDNIKNGTSIQYLGKDLRIYMKISNKNTIMMDEKSIILTITKKHSLDQVFSKFWRKQAKLFFEKELDIIFNKIFKKHNLERPKLHIRKMQTLWGSCTKYKNKITLNEYLLKADTRCIQYVILHELTHLLYTYHNQEFYDFLTIHMPDWKERKKQLDTEVVQNL